MDVRMAASLAPAAVANVAAFCREQGISRTTFYKWQVRFAVEGVDGLKDRSHAAHTVANLTPASTEDLIVGWRKQLEDDGADSGPDSIRSAMLSAGQSAPSRATIARILTRRGVARVNARKRPRSSLQRFTYARPNECWQSDWTHWQLRDGTDVAIAGTLDDHSRLLVGLAAVVGEGTLELVWSVMAAAIGQYGVPVRSLTDNGWVYSGQRRGKVCGFETNLHALGTHTICSTPRHPQTCGKIERHWQTLKRWLTAHGPYDTVDSLNADLARFRGYYNAERPHRALGGRTPAHAYAATVAARPAARPLPAAVTVTTTLVASNGNASVGGYLINVGHRWRSHTLTAVVDGNHIVLFDHATLVRALDVDPRRKYQAAGPDRPQGRHTPRNNQLSTIR